jgi:hypothetical protein
MPKVAKPSSGVTPAKQIASFIAKLNPDVAKLIRTARAALRRQFPTAIEQVYDNYNFLAIGFCTTVRTSDCIVSIAANSKGEGLSFYHGARLPDPNKILLGNGKQGRLIRLEDPGTLRKPAVISMLNAAAEQARTPLPEKGAGYTMIKSVSEKQRPRR